MSTFNMEPETISDELFNAVFNSEKNIVYLYDFSGKFIDANKSAIEILGIDEEEIESLNFFDILDDEQGELLLEQMEDIREGKKIEPQQIEFADKQGKPIWIESHKTLLKRDEEPYAILEVAHDISEQVMSQSRLEQSYHLISNLTSQVPGMVYQYQLFADGSSSFPFCTPAVRDLYDLSPADVRDDSSPFFNRIHAEDFPMVVKKIKESGRKKVPFTCEYRVEHPEKGLRWHAMNAKPEGMTDGSIIWYGFISDITEEKIRPEPNTDPEDPELGKNLQDDPESVAVQADNDQISKKERLFNIIEGTKIGTWEWNVQTGETIFNDNWANIIGYELDEISPTDINTWLKNLHPDDIQKSNQLLQRHFDGESEYYHCECRMKHKDGHWVWILDRGKVVSWDQEGKPEWMLGTHQDITYQIESQKALRDSEVKFQSLIDQASEIMFLHRTDGKLIEVNQAAVDSLGYSKEELLSMNISNLDPDPDAMEHKQNLWQQLKAGNGSRSYQSRYRAKDGKVFSVDSILSKINLGEEDYILALSRNVSENQMDEQDFYQIINGLNEAVFITDYEGNFIDANSSAVRLLGYSREELKSMGPGDVDVDMTIPEIKKVLKTSGEEDAGVYETRIKTKDEKIVPVEISGNPVDYLGKKVILHLIRDLTERRESESALSLNEEKYTALFEQSADGIYLHDANGKILDVNRAALIQTGYTKDEVIGKNIFDFSTSQGDREEIINHWKNWPSDLNYKIEDEHKHMKGHYFPVEISTGKVKIGEEEQIIAIVRDITERKEIERSLAENALRQESLLKASKTLASSLEIEKTQQKAVDVATELLSLECGTMYVVEDESLFLQSASPKLPEDYPEQDRRIALDDHPHIRKAIDKKEIIFIRDVENEEFTAAEMKMLGGAGLKSVLFIPVIVRKHNNAVLVLGTSEAERTFSLEETDVYKTLANQIALALENAQLYLSVKKQADELEEKVIKRTAKLDEANKEMEAFTYSVSHDLRAPLRAINSFSRYMETDYADKLDDEAKRHIKVIKENTFKMDQLIRDLLKLSRLSRSELEMIDLDMTSIARSMYYEMATELEKQEFELKLEELPHAKGDITMIKQLWSNLLGNALKYSSLSETKKIEIGAKEEEDKIIYFVRDHGEGFDPIYKEKLFGIFQRFHKEDEFPGTGVGLAVVKRVLDKHNGSSWADSEPGKGATFYFSLPKNPED